MKPKIFPYPKNIQLKKKKVDFGNRKWLCLTEACSSHLRERLQEGLSQINCHFSFGLRLGRGILKESDTLLKLQRKKNIPNQGYILDISKKGAFLSYSSEAGAYYGFLTWVQLIEEHGTSLPELVIKDEPDFPSRGVMLDVSRCKVPTMQTLKQLIDRLADMKINQVQLYIEHTFAFDQHQPVWHDSSPFTHEEILEIDNYCHERFIELVPNLNSFGHLERWLKHPDYRHLAECPENINPGCLAPNQDSLRFLEELYDEYLPHFTSSTFNVGCDETWELGKGRSKKRAEKTSTTKVYLEFIKKIHKLVSKKGKRMQFWGDIILHQPELIHELPKDIIALNWGYESTHPYEKECPAFAESGVEFYVCPGSSSWNSITGRTDNCLDNLKKAAKYGLKYGATGYLNTDWGDGGHHQVLPISYLGFTAGAGLSWSYKANEQNDWADVLSRHFFRDTTGNMGKVCLDLGRTLNRLPGLKRQNSSAIGQLMSRGLGAGRLDLSKLTKAQFNQAESWLEKVRKNISKARPQCSDHELVIREFEHALSMSLHAINRGRYVRFSQGDLVTLRKEFQKVLMGHEDQWLARNRRGGLHESSSILRASADLMEKSQS